MGSGRRSSLAAGPGGAVIGTGRRGAVRATTQPEFSLLDTRSRLTEAPPRPGPAPRRGHESVA